MSKELIDDQKNKYQKNFNAFGDTPQGVLLNNKTTHQYRFERLLKNLDLSTPFTIHDIGSGTVALHEYLNEKEIKHTYHGTEIVPEMIELSKKKYPYLKLYEKDILSNNNIEICDYCVLSGTFNLAGNIDAEKWGKFVFDTIKKMFEISSKATTFNFLTSHRTFSDETLAYFDPAEILNFCIKELSRYVIIDHAYPLYEFSVTVYKNDYMKALHPDKDFIKYFKNDK